MEQPRTNYNSPPEPDARSTGARKRPVQKVRLGNIEAAIWENQAAQAPERPAYYNVTFSKGYKDGNDWKNTDSFGRDDLLVLAKVADLAHSWICSEMRNAAGANNGTGGGNKDW